MKFFILALVCVGALTGCVLQTPEEQLQDRGRVVKACVESGGEWYNTPGWGESCHYDSRKEANK